MLIPEVLPSLLSANKLKSLLKMSSSFYDTFRLVEANPGDNFREHYLNGHIDKAVYLNTMECTEPSQLYPRNLPDPNCFKDYIGSLGISNKHHLILYDRSPFGFYASSRMWWIFRLFGHEKLSILNGGIRKWYELDQTLSTELPNFAQEKFEIKENKTLIRDFSDINKNLVNKKELVVDVRGPGEFNKVDSDGELNNIPNSVNLPYSDLFDELKGGLKSKEELQKLFAEKKVDLDKALVASCMTGMTACSLAFAAHLLGKSQVPVYYGSWTEYSQRKNN